LSSGAYRVARQRESGLRHGAIFGTRSRNSTTGLLVPNPNAIVAADNRRRPSSPVPSGMGRWRHVVHGYPLPARDPSRIRQRGRGRPALRLTQTAMARPRMRRYRSSMEYATRADLDRMLEKIVGHIEATGMRTHQQLAVLESRLDRFEAGVEARFDAIEARFDAIEARFEAIEDRIATMDERFSTLALRVEHFENRVMAAVRDVRDQVAILAERIDVLEARVGAVAGQVEEMNTRIEALEAGTLALSGRLDGVGEDMRQRFRIVNDRLAQMAA
jgi:methyl-accepting chemotaxis protein